MEWSENVQRAVLASILDGKLGLRADTIRPELFTEERSEIAAILLKFQKDTGKWPPRDLLNDLALRESKDGKSLIPEIRSVLLVAPETRLWATGVAREAIRRKALLDAAIDVSDIASGCMEHFGRSRDVLEAALSAGEHVNPPFLFTEGVLQRHEKLSSNESILIAPTGIPTLDRIKGGGLLSGELGLILGPTKRGKSHLSCNFGAEHLRRGGYVLHITLELRDLYVARRYDRCLTDMRQEEIEADKELFLRKWNEACPNPERLTILSYPRFSLSISTVGDLLRKSLDRFGKKCLLLLDYGSILRPTRQDSRHLEVGRIHEALSALAMSESVPVWTPFQTNRSGLSETDNGDIGLHQAGESFEALQHADLILTMSQSRHDEMRKRLRLVIEGSRESGSGVAVCQYDWSKSRIWEIGDESGEDVKGSA